MHFDKPTDFYEGLKALWEKEEEDLSSEPQKVDIFDQTQPVVDKKDVPVAYSDPSSDIVVSFASTDEDNYGFKSIETFFPPQIIGYPNQRPIFYEEEEVINDEAPS